MTNTNETIDLYREDFENETAWYEVCDAAGFSQTEAMMNDTLKIVWCQASLTKEN